MCIVIAMIAPKTEVGKVSVNDSSSSMDATTSNIATNIAEIKAKIISGQCKIKIKKGKSKVWDIIGKVEDENGQEIPSIVACKKCCSVLKFQQTSTSNLTKHKCFKNLKESFEKKPKTDVDVDTKKEVLRIVTQWTIQNCRSFKIIEDNGIRQFTEVMISIGAQYGSNVDVDKLLPHPTTISRNIDKMYDVCFQKVKSELSTLNGTGYALTSDLWSDNYLKSSYLSLTIHYITTDGKLVKRLIALKCMEFQPCTNDRIRHKVQQALEEFNCSLEHSIIVTDRGSNMKAAFAAYDHIYCVNHLLHNTIEKSIKEEQSINELCTKCTKLVKYFKVSGGNAALPTTLKSFSPTRWNTIYYLLCSVEKNWIEIGNILQEKQQIQRINGISLSLVSAVVRTLKPFEESSKKLEGDAYPTLHLAILHVYRLKRLCEEDNDDCIVIKSWKQKLCHLLQSTVLKNLTVFHKIAIYLFPTNKLLQFESNEKDVIKNECKRLMSKYISNCSSENDQNTMNSKASSSETVDLFTGFIEPRNYLNIEDKINTEIQSYDNVNEIVHDEFDVLQWWHFNKLQYPLLYKLSCKIFATPASSASSERTFSYARNLISEKLQVNFKLVNG